ncbi:hypothetical protein BS50DRAFT_639584 [Corynespora cassiicola Philippines]|uniref:Carrier domain-containing protein n=1 Tax=Corynespora cassiicola Philippines TaxID=1448308 RepID=A0A2T2N686_CORCC|nr:hypothetical protein BS50DRAFT_639584 [Corynespora cassiicola Philippines]
MTSSFEAVMALPTLAAYCTAKCFQDAFARYREMGQRKKTRQMIYRNGLYRTGELGFLRLPESTFLKSSSPTSEFLRFDPLAEAQLTTCFEPGELTKMAGKHYDATTQLPRWHSDRKFSHLFQSMNDHISGKEKNLLPKSTNVPAITAAVDAAIRGGSSDDAVRFGTTAIIERSAALLFIPREEIDAAKSVAHYGVDSLIAVELRNWFTVLFQDTIPL